MCKRDVFIDNEEQISKIVLWLETVLFAYSIDEADVMRIEECTSMNDVEFFYNQQIDTNVVIDSNGKDSN